MNRTPPKIITPRSDTILTKVDGNISRSKNLKLDMVNSNTTTGLLALATPKQLGEIHCFKCSESFIRSTKEKEEILKCCICASQFHLTCTGIPLSLFESTMVHGLLWRCDHCKMIEPVNLPSDVLRLSEQIVKLELLVSSLSSALINLRDEISVSLKPTKKPSSRASTKSPVTRVTRSAAKLLVSPIKQSVNTCNTDIGLVSTPDQPSNVAIEVVNHASSDQGESTSSGNVGVNVSDIDPWTEVVRKGKTRKLLVPEVLGTGPSNLLLKAAPAPPAKKMLYISRCDPAATNDEIIEHINNNFNFKVESCIKLVNKDADVGTLNFVSFKVAVPAEDFGHFLKPSLWPAGILVREFKHKTGNSKNI